MIRINLLPYRAARKKENILRQFNIFLLAFLIVSSFLIFFNIWLSNKIDTLNSTIQNTKAMLAQTEAQSKQVDQIKKALETLEQKTNVIRNIEMNRRDSVLLLENMTEMVAENKSISTSDASADINSKPIKRLWFNNLQTSGGKIHIRGVALDNKTIADFMSRLEESKRFKNVTLNTIKQQKVNNLNLKSFEIVCEKVTLEKPIQKNDAGSNQGKK